MINNKQQVPRLFLVFYVLSFTFCVSRFAIHDVHAQDKPISRLYIPVSSQLTIAKTNDTETLVVKDYLSSTREVVDKDGTLKFENNYFPFGNKMDDGRAVGDDGKKSDKLFTSHRKLDNLSVYQAGARFYSPTTGQFIQPDRVEGINRYAYVRNNPIRFTDPTGNEAKGIYAQIPDTDFKNKDFPNALPLVEGTYSVNDQRPLRTLFSEDRELDNIVMDYSYRLNADYRLINQRTSFLRDFADTFRSENPYNEKLQAILNKKKMLDKYDLQIPLLALTINPVFLSENKNYRDYAREMEIGAELSLSEKIRQEKLICVDYANFTTYFIARHGIRSGIISINNPDLDLYHNMNVIEIDNIQYALDVTNNFFERFDEPAVSALYGSGKYMKLIEPYGEAIYNDSWHQFFNQRKGK